MTICLDNDIMLFSCLFLQRFTIEQKVQSVDSNRLDIESILTIPVVDQSDTGNITCIGTNEAGVNKSTTSLMVVGKLLDNSNTIQAHMGILAHIPITELDC